MSLYDPDAPKPPSGSPLHAVYRSLLFALDQPEVAMHLEDLNYGYAADAILKRLKADDVYLTAAVQPADWIFDRYATKVEPDPAEVYEPHGFIDRT